jgi:hypothetical protein
MNGLIAPSRRLFVGGLIGLIAAPAIVKASSLMPVKMPKPIDCTLVSESEEMFLFDDFQFKGVRYLAVRVRFMMAGEPSFFGARPYDNAL